MKIFSNLFSYLVFVFTVRMQQKCTDICEVGECLLYCQRPVGAQNILNL